MGDNELEKGEILSESRDERHARQTEEQFSELGRFVQNFEQLVFAIRTSCLSLLPTRNGNDQMLVNILLHHHVMTAWPLFECMRALYGEVIKQAGDVIIPEEVTVIRGVLKQAAKDMSDLVSRRNALLHATWYIGWASSDETDFSELKLTKGKTCKDGLDFHSPLRDLQELKELSAQCNELKDHIFLLYAVFLNRVSRPEDGPRARFNFEKVNGRWRKKGKKP